MKYSLYSVYDAAAGMYSQPQVYANDHVALRSFTYAANDESSSICMSARDYTLFRVGSFDDESGSVIPEATPVSLGVAINLKKES